MEGMKRTQIIQEKSDTSEPIVYHSPTTFECKTEFFDKVIFHEDVIFHKEVHMQRLKQDTILVHKGKEITSRWELFILFICFWKKLS